VPSRGKAGDRRAALARACAALKVFPLHGVVVLPGTPAPFHVFEPRYRALFADALDGDRILAIPSLVRPEGASETRADVFPVAGAGVIEAEERLPDGRFHVVVRGLARVRLLEEIESGKPYREFRAEVLEDVHPAGGPGGLAREADALRQLVIELAQRLPPESGAAQLAEAVAQLREPGALADVVAAAAVSEPEAKQAVLEELDVARRLRRVQGEVAAVVLLLSRGRTPSA
jgi:Lon protease-like protein